MDKFIDELIERYPILESCRESIYKAYVLMVESYQSAGKLLIAGNGGSASDSEHIVGELMKGFVLPRRIDDSLRDELCKIDKDMGTELADKIQGALPAIALCNHNGLNTAFLNDVDGSMCFAQQVNGYGNANDVFLEFRHQEIQKTYYMLL